MNCSDYPRKYWHLQTICTSEQQGIESVSDLDMGVALGTHLQKWNCVRATVLAAASAVFVPLAWKICNSNEGWLRRLAAVFCLVCGVLRVEPCWWSDITKIHMYRFLAEL